MDLVPTPSLQDLKSSIAPSSSESENLQRLKAGRDAAKTILSRYPDYGKAPAEYLASIAELLADMSPENLRSLTDKRIGISAKCKFLPTHADFVEFVEQIEAKRYSARDLRRGRVPELIGNGTKAEPFPKLAAAFKDQPQLLHRNFDCLFDASRALATRGREAAEQILRRGKDIA